MEMAYGKGQEIKRALIKEFYEDAQVAELIGEEYIETWKKWRTSSMAGDKLVVTFQSKLREENPVKVKQLLELIMFLSQQTIKTGNFEIPKYEIDHYVEDLVRRLGLGKPVKHEPTAIEARMAAEAVLGGGEPQPGGNGPAGPKAKIEERPPGRQQLSAAAQKVGPSEGARPRRNVGSFGGGQ